MSKKFYILTFLILSATIVILSATYSKDSGSDEFISNSKTMEELKITYQDSDIYKVNYIKRLEEANKVEGKIINILNTSNKEVNYNLNIICEDCINKIYYSINNSKLELITNNIIYSNTLTSYGTKDDLDSLNIRFVSVEDYKEEIKVAINIVDKNIANASISSYVNINNKTYQVLGIYEDKVKLIAFTNEEEYLYENNYLSIEELLNTCNITNIIDIVNTDCWIKKQDNFWLKNRYTFNNNNINSNIGNYKGNEVIEINKDSLILNGNGTINSPYEVNYEG